MTIDTSTHVLQHRALIVLFLCLVLQWPVRGQYYSDRITVPLRDPGRPSHLKISLNTGSISIKGYEGKNIIVEARLRYYPEQQPEKRGNLWRIPYGGTGLVAEEDDNVVTVRAGTSIGSRYVDFSRTVDVIIQTPRRTSINVKTTNLGDITIEDISGELVVSNENGAVRLDRVSGSATVAVLNGSISATFVEVDSANAMSFSLLDGTIDVSFPPNLKALFIVRSDWGELYSDFNLEAIQRFETKAEGNHGWGKWNWMHSGKTIKGWVNGGGQEIQFNNFNGNTVVRKIKS